MNQAEHSNGLLSFPIGKITLGFHENDSLSKMKRSLTADAEHNETTFHALLETGGGIGNVNSKAKGTGARFNNGKVPYEVLPLEVILDWIDLNQCKQNGIKYDPLYVLEWLALWQAGSDDALFEALNGAVTEVGLPGFAEAARVFKHVTEREVNPYPMWNWMKGMPWSVPYGCAIRHLTAELTGQTHDPETGLLHRGHTVCNLIMLLLYAKTFTEGDNRPPCEFL